MCHNVLSQRLRIDVIEYLIEQKQIDPLSDKEIEYQNYKGKYYLKLLRLKTVRKKKVLLYSFGSYATHSLNYMVICYDEKRFFLKSKDFLTDIVQFKMLSNLSNSEKMLVIKSFIPIMIKVYESNLDSHNEKVLILD